MAELIYSTTITGFVQSEGSRQDGTYVYEAVISTGAPSITTGTIYTILWDGKKYVCEAGEGYLGNEPLDLGGGLETNEPFVYIDNGDSTGKVFTTDTSGSHDISIYEGLDNPDGYLVYDCTIPFVDNDTFYAGTFFTAAPVLVVGNTYTVIWDGEYFVCNAESVEMDGVPTIVIGNKSIRNLGDDTNEPFLYAFISDYGVGGIFTLSNEAEHVISVYDGVLEQEESDPNILLNDTFGFSYSSDISAYYCSITENPPVIVAGNMYTVTWGTRRYVCEAYNVTTTNDGGTVISAIALGEKSIYGDDLSGGISGVNTPFLYLYVPEYSQGAFYTKNYAPVYEIKVYNGLDTPEGYMMYQLSLPFEDEEADGVYLYSNNGMPAITAGNAYTVIWDNKFFTSTAYIIEDDLVGEVVYLGNLSISNIGDASDTEEPFLYTYLPGSDYGYGSFCTNDTAAEHVISVYDGELKPSVENKSLYFDTEAGSGNFTANVSNPSIPLVAGEAYSVVWDEDEFICTAKEATVPLYGVDTDCVILGNLSIVSDNSENTNEPFLYAYCADEVFCEYNLTEPGVYTEAIGYTWYKISDATPSYEQIIDAELSLSADGGTPITDSVTASQCLINDYRGCAFMIESAGLGFIVAYCSGTIEHMIATIDIPEKGFYLAGPSVDNFIQFSGGIKASNFAWFTIPETSDNEHVVSIRSISTTEPDDPDLSEAVNVVLYNINGRATTYYGIKTVTLNTDVPNETETFSLGTAPDETKVELDLSGGNQVVENTETHLLKKVVIQKPASLAPENIKKGVEIAGVEGDLVGEGVSKEVELSLAEGDQNVEADPDTLMSNVLIKKPETLRAENIKKGVEIAGIEGELEGELIDTGVSKTVDLNDLDLSGGSDSVVPDQDTLLSEVVITAPEELTPENIVKDVKIAGITGTFESFDLTNESLQYLGYNVDVENKKIILCKVFYDILYEKTGSCDVTVPNKINGYDVVILAI